MNRKVLILGGLAVAALVVMLANGFGADPRLVTSPLLDKPAPEFALADLEGNEVRLRALRGKPVLINFWATWCPPCVAEHASLRRLATGFENRVEFLGVIYQDDEAAIREFLAERGAWGTTLADPQSLTAIRYGVFGAPETFVVDAEGRVTYKITGQLDERRLGEVLAGLL